MKRFTSFFVADDKQYKTVDNSYELLYTVCVDDDISLNILRGTNMNIIVNNTSMQPIYEQIVEQIKKMVVSGELKPEDILPSVRTLASHRAQGVKFRRR